MLKTKSPGKLTIIRYSLLACAAAFAICLSGAHAITRGSTTAKLEQKDATALTELSAIAD